MVAGKAGVRLRVNKLGRLRRGRQTTATEEMREERAATGGGLEAGSESRPAKIP